MLVCHKFVAASALLLVSNIGDHAGNRRLLLPSPIAGVEEGYCAHDVGLLTVSRAAL